MFTQAESQLHTLRDLLRFSVSRFNESDLFFGHGSSNAYDEAAYLILHTLHLPPDQMESFLDARLTNIEISQVLSMIKRRSLEKIPAAYLTQEAWLGDFSFYVDKRVLIPRSFIAELLREQLSPWVTDPSSVHSVLDLCTGSGCLAILLAHAFENATVDATDISDEALEVANKNVGDYDLNRRIHLLQSDLFGALEGRRYDLIISNPPYVNAESMASLPKEYQYEPRHGLASGHDGLEATKEILKSAANYLNDKGILIVEIGHNRTALEEAFPQTPFTWLETSAGDGFVFMLTRDHLPSK
ncbi:MAG: 50S ribosomal protein L3 N(5)-glutamine methyltransferase [Nitrosomonadaceae bacterium]